MASPRSLFLALLLLSVPAGPIGCATATEQGDDIESAEEPITRVTSEETAAAQREDISAFTYARLTPTTQKIMRASRWWMHEQDDDPRYPKPRMCATNVSKVLFLSGITTFDQEGVRMLIGDVRNAGGLVVRMPRDPNAFARAVTEQFGGEIPAGTILAGMNVQTSNPGDQHIGFVGHTDRDGTVWIYHNNWYRPENEGGRRKAHMVSEENLRRGFQRQWMATPWLRISRDARGAITRVTSLLPALDDMDPFHPQYQVTLAVLPDVVRELQR
jgi:hypothetical protein